MIKILGKIKAYRPTKKTVKKKHKGFLIYKPTKDEPIQVLAWMRWPSYDFIFGVPTKNSRFYKDEVGFFQYRDTRLKKVINGFYIDKEELERLLEGFKLIKDYEKK